MRRPQSLVLILRDARTRQQVCGTSSACALLRMRTSVAYCTVHHTNSLPRSRGAFLRPGFCILASLTPNRGVGGAPRNVRVLGGTPVGVHITRHARRLRGALRPITRDARLSALHRGGFSPGAALPSPAFAPDRLQRAPRSQVVVPGGRLPGPPGANGYKPPPRDATPRSAFRIVSRTRPQ